MGLREFFRGAGGKVIAVLLLIAAGVAVWYSVRNSFGTDPAMATSNTRIFIDTKGNSWRQAVYPGMPQPPVKSPVTGNMDGYEAELCRWTKEGTARSEPFPVLLNDTLHPGSREPTFCPDCGRLVHRHNPSPLDTSQPPMTKEEYLKENGS